MNYEQITFEQRERVGLITLNRPERMNAWTYRMDAELVDAIDRCNAEDGIGAIVLTGAGRGFCGGADIGDTFATRLEADEASGADSGNRRDWVALLRASKPVIAAVNGAAVGVGATMILPCDVLIASDRARFGMFFVRMGLVPELASSHFLVARMGFGPASEMCLTGRLYDAAECRERRLVDRVVEHEQLLDEALRTAEEIARNPSRQLRWIKELLTQNGAEGDLTEVQRREMARLEAAYRSPEHQEAVDAFLNKREPEFHKLGAEKLGTE